jgi:hypothetical protein
MSHRTAVTEESEQANKKAAASINLKAAVNIRLDGVSLQIFKTTMFKLC